MLLKTATDYADHLFVHVNHLNRTVKAATKRTTSDLVNSRIVQEGVQMLKHTAFSIVELASGLGFGESSSFSNFIKKHTGIPPMEHRAS